MPWRRRKSKTATPSEHGVTWLLDEDNPWPVPVLDVRGFTQVMLSTTTDRDAASNAISFGRDDGSAFMAAVPSNLRRVETSLRYRVDRVLADGVLFVPRQMEHKWAIFVRDHRMLFVRSWTRRLHVVASTRLEAGEVVVSDLVGSFVEPEEPPEQTIAMLDFLVRTHALGSQHPAPVPSGLDATIDQIAMYCFSLYGNLAWFAASERFDAPVPREVLRSHSLLHLAIVRRDFAAAQAQLDAGVPVDLLAGDGSSALHWAIVVPGVDGFSWLLDRGLDVDVRSTQGATTLMNLAQGDPEHIDVGRMTWLLDHGADPNAADERGFTALHRVAERGSEPAVRLLVARGADLDAVAMGEHTARSLAAAHAHDEIVALLDAGAGE
jgi:hypothetical protein